jgi:tight adherence protein C
MSGPGLLALCAALAIATLLRPRRTRGSDERAPSVPAGRHWPPPSARSRRTVIERAYPQAVELIVLAVRAGHLPHAAIRESLARLPPAVWPAFAQVIARCDAGERFADALGALASVLGPLAGPLADTLAAADRYGLPLAPVLERLAAEARLQRRRQAEALARQLPVRLAGPLVLCTLPAFVLLAIVPLLLAALSSLNP